MFELSDIAVLRELSYNTHNTNVIVSRPEILINDSREWFGAASGLCEICDGGLE
jgi:hypothetical protein